MTAQEVHAIFTITAHQYGVDVPRARWNELTDAEKRAWGEGGGGSSKEKTQMTVTIDTDRLARVETLKHGNHEPPNGDFAACVMEAVAYVAGEPWSDHPECASPVITTFMIAWNDGLPSDAERDRLLKPLIPLIIGTRGSKALENRRATMAADWLIRVHTPAWLRLAGLTKEADALSGLPEITDFAQTPSIMPALKASRSAAAKAWAAAWDAAGNAAWDAAGNAAWDAARAAAWDAARAAAWDAAWDAARAAARAAAWGALKSTQDALQQSALDLVKRMCALTEVA